VAGAEPGAILHSENDIFRQDVSKHLRLQEVRKNADHFERGIPRVRGRRSRGSRRGSGTGRTGSVAMFLEKLRKSAHRTPRERREGWRRFRRTPS
jgi:hypothetical protein